MARLIELNLRRQDGSATPGDTVLVNPEYIVSVMPGRPFGSGYAPQGSRVVMAAQNRVGSAEAPLDIQVTQGVDEVAQKVYEAVHAD